VAGQQTNGSHEQPASEDETIQEAIANETSAIHARWLMTTRDDLRGQSPRDVLVARREFVDFDLNARELQWSFQGEAPRAWTSNLLRTGSPALARMRASFTTTSYDTCFGVR
jgi:hypothetical protein